MDSDKWIEAFTDIRALEKVYVEFFEDALEEVHDETIKNALKRLAKLSEIRRWISSLYAEGMMLPQDIVVEPFIEKIAEEREFLDKLK